MPGNSFKVITEMPPATPLIFNAELCNGCKRCVDICQVDVLLPGTVNGSPPVVGYPGECWYCGCCVIECPIEGAIRMRHPLMNQVHWVERGSLK